MVGVGVLLLLASPLRHSALRVPTERAAPADPVSTESVFSDRALFDNDEFLLNDRVSTIPTPARNQWEEDRELKPVSVPDSVPGRSAFLLKWSVLRDAVEANAGVLSDETEILMAQESRLISASETEKEKRRVINGEAGRSRSRPLGSAAAKGCGASPSAHLSYSDGRMHFEDARSASFDIPLGSTHTRFDGGYEKLSAFRDKWIYMHGDSTLRQECQTFVEAVTGRNIGFNQFKECMRDEKTCWKTIPGHSTAYKQMKQHEGTTWEFQFEGPTWDVNERTLSMWFRSLNTTLTCDWKASLFRKYDRWLLKKRFQWQAPDLYITSPGMHDCSWKATRSMGDAYHALQAETFFEYLNAFLPDKTKLLWLSAQQSANFRPGGTVDGVEVHRQCVTSVNTAARRLAAERLVTFVDREPLTRNLSEMARAHPDIEKHISQEGVHYTSPFMQIIFRYISEAGQCLMKS
jgi:hypothetical protein